MAIAIGEWNGQGYTSPEATPVRTRLLQVGGLPRRRARRSWASLPVASERLRIVPVVDRATALFWAKRGSDVPQFHPLVSHLLDVGAAVEAILRQASPMSLQRRLGGMGDVASAGVSSPAPWPTSAR